MTGRRALSVSLTGVVITCLLFWMLGRSERSSLTTEDELRPSQPAGRADAPLASRVRPLEVALDDRAPVPLPAPSRAKLRPQGPQRWCCRVVDAESGQPIAGATLRIKREPMLWLIDGREEEVPVESEEGWTSNEDGRFPPLVADRAVRAIEHQGHATAQVFVGEGHESPENEVVVVLARLATLEVFVRDGQGKAWSGREIRVLGYASASRPIGADLFDDLFGTADDVKWKAATDGRGRCEIREVIPGMPLSMKLFDGDKLLRRWDDSLELRPGEWRTIEWRVERGCRLSGSIVDETGQGIEGLAIELREERSSASHGIETSDSNGEFEFDDVPPSRWMLELARSERGQKARPEALGLFVAEPVTIDVSAADEERSVVLYAYSGVFIRGRVVGSKGLPAGDCRVSARGEQSGHLYEAMTGDQGVFELGPLLIEQYRLECNAISPDDRFDTDAPVVIASGGDDNVILTLTAGGVVQGRVLEGRRGLGDTRVWLYPMTSEGLAGSFGTITEPGGRFSFDHRPPGTYRLAAWNKRGLVARPQPVTVLPGKETEVELALVEGARVTIVPPRRSEGAYLRVWAGDWLIEDDWIQSPTECVVPAGVVRCELVDDRGQLILQEATVSVAAGESRRIEWAAPSR